MMSDSARIVIQFIVYLCGILAGVLITRFSDDEANKI